jgi:Tfp pilus assembly protein PilO
VSALHQPFWRKRLLWPGVALLGLNLLVGVAYTVRRGVQQRGIVARAEALREEAETLRRSVRDLQRRSDTARENVVAEKRFFAEVVGSRQATLVPALAEIEKLAAEPGLKAGSRSFTPDPVKDLPLLRLQVAVTLTGGYKQLVEFLSRVERSKHFVTVDKVLLREGAQGDESAAASEGSLAVQLSAWFRAEEGDGGR